MTTLEDRRRTDAPATAASQNDVFVARQPIYDSAMAVMAFELLYRPSPAATRAKVTDPRQATLEVISSAALEIGLDRLSDGQPVHINFPMELLVDVPDLPLPPNLVVIEVLEDVKATPAVIEGIRKLRARGHRIALDDYSPKVSDPRLLEYADIVKLEISHPPAAERGIGIYGIPGLLPATPADLPRQACAGQPPHDFAPGCLAVGRTVFDR
jgi:c-di-GMP-related signal transduction protein